MKTSELKMSLSPNRDAEADAYHARRTHEIWKRRTLPAIGITGFIAAWWAVITVFDVKPFIAPSPVLVLGTLFAKRDVLLANVVPTAFEAASGFALGVLVAILLATLFVHNKTAKQVFFPIAVLFNSIPIVAKAPILVLLMGNGIEPKITIAALVCFFPTLVNMVQGLDAVNPQALELMRVLSASKAEIFFKLRLLNALPYLFATLRIAASMSVIGALIGEWVGSNEGIGSLILQATYNFDSALLYAAIVMSASLSGVFFLTVAMLERWLLKWQPETTR